MLPEDKLDALLPVFARKPTSTPPSTTLSADDAVLRPLLSAAAQLRPLAEQRPDARFAQALEQRLLAHAALLVEAAPSLQVAPPSPAGSSSDLPTVEDIYPPRTEFIGDPTHVFGRSRSPRSDIQGMASRTSASRPRRPAIVRLRSFRLLPQAIAASFILLLGVGTLTAAAAAGPGSFLYPLHRLEQGVELSLSSNPADRFRLHLVSARDALTALDSAHSRGASAAAAYQQALAVLGEEERAAAQELGRVPAGAEHDDLAAQLRSFQAQGIHDLHDALSTGDPLDMGNRVATTHVLGQFGDHVVSISHVQVEKVGSDAGDDKSGDGSTQRGARAVVITITGDNFAPGAVVLINGFPAGTITQLTQTKIVVLATLTDVRQVAGSLVVTEPDGTAAQFSARSISDDSKSILPTTATPSSRPDGRGSGDDHSGKSGRPTPTPPVPTPTAHP